MNGHSSSIVPGEQHQKHHQTPGLQEFPHLTTETDKDGKPLLNRYSTFLTREHDFPGAQVCFFFTFFTITSSFCLFNCLLAT